jgi:hypothetical protein
MKSLLVAGLLPALMLLLAVGTSSPSAEKSEPRQAHMVFFTLKDHSKEARDALVASCEKYLSGIEGVLSFSTGTIAEDVEEPKVSVRDFDVALHLVFVNKAAGQAYLVHPMHKKFVEENLASFAGVRVFDSYLAPEKH